MGGANSLRAITAKMRCIKNKAQRFSNICINSMLFVILNRSHISFYKFTGRFQNLTLHTYKFLPWKTITLHILTQMWPVLVIQNFY